MKRVTRVFLVLCLAWFAPAGASVYLVREIAEKFDQPLLRAQSTELLAIHEAVSARAGVEATLYYAPVDDVNAFATEIEGRKIVVVQQGLLDLIDDDRDAIAAVLGHELAHHKADHIRAGRRKQQGVRTLGVILGAVVGAKIGSRNGAAAGALGGAAVGVGAELVALKFSRSQELEADRLALRWVAEAGFNPDGMLRLQKRIAGLEGKKRRSAILSTHPASKKRYASAARIVADDPPPDDVLQRPAAPLVGADSLAAAERAIQGQANARLASVLVPMEAPTAALVAPLADKTSFEAHAALANAMLHAGPDGEAAVLKRHKLTRERWLSRNAEVGRRLQSDRRVAVAYQVAFHRATQGRYAAHGRDVADSKALGKPLALEPPFPIATAAAAIAALAPYQQQHLDAALRAKLDRDVLAPFGIDYYEFQVGHAWWMRKAEIALLLGDGTVVTALMADATAAAARARANATSDAPADETAATAD